MDAKAELDIFYRKMQTKKYAKGSISVAIINALSDDLNTPLAISELHKEADREYYFSTLLGSARLMGLLNHTPEEWFKGNIDNTTWIDNQILLRNEARKNNDYNLSDKIRNALKDKGIILEDTSNGTTWRKE